MDLIALQGKILQTNMICATFGMSPMQIRLLKVCTKEEIEKCFGLIVNKNGHQYINYLDPKLITKVERLWMIVHQKPYVLASRIIILGMARGIMCE